MATTRKITATPTSRYPISADNPATPPCPSAAAISATTKKINAQCSMAASFHAREASTTRGEQALCPVLLRYFQGVTRCTSCGSAPNRQLRVYALHARRDERAD